MRHVIFPFLKISERNTSNVSLEGGGRARSATEGKRQIDRGRSKWAHRGVWKTDATRQRASGALWSFLWYQRQKNWSMVLPFRWMSTLSHESMPLSSPERRFSATSQSRSAP